MIAEVMSASTESVDRREKLIAYQKLPTLLECLLIEQNEVQVEHFQRVSSREWGMTTLEIADAIELVTEKRPRCVVFMETLPKTALGKVQKDALKLTLAAK